MATKQYILRIKKQIDTLRKTDSKLKDDLEKWDKQSEEIRDSVQDLEGLEELFPDIKERTEMFNEININLETINRENKELKEAILNYAKSKNEQFRQFADQRASLFESFVFGRLDNDVLLHALDTFTLYENRQVNLEQAKEMGYHEYHVKKNPYGDHPNLS